MRRKLHRLLISDVGKDGDNDAIARRNAHCDLAAGVAGLIRIKRNGEGGGGDGYFRSVVNLLVNEDIRLCIKDDKRERKVRLTPVSGICNSSRDVFDCHVRLPQIG